MNNADTYGLFASGKFTNCRTLQVQGLTQIGVRIINAGGSIDQNGKVTGRTSSKVKRALTAEEREELGALAAFFDEENSEGGKHADMDMWGPVFNSTVFPEGSTLTEGQKAMVVKALMGDVPGEPVAFHHAHHH